MSGGSRHLAAARRTLGTLVLAATLASCTGTPSSSTTTKRTSHEQPPPAQDSSWVYVADDDLYRAIGEQHNIGCENTSFEIYSRTGTPFAQVEQLTDDTCMPISPPGAVNLVGFGGLYRVSDEAQDINEIVYFSCWPRGDKAQLIVRDGEPEFRELECFVDESRVEWNRNAIGIRGAIHDAEFDAGANNSWTLSAYDMNFSDTVPTRVYQPIAGELFSCQQDATAR